MAFLSFPSPTQLKNLANPTENQDAVTLAYLDSALNGSGNIVVANVSANTVTSNTVTSNTVTSNNVSANTLTVNGVINLGEVANVKISGGTDGYVLSTDGTGNLSWVEQTGGSGNLALPSVNVDSFTADGSTNSFQLTVTPASKSLVFINIDGVFQIRDSFDLFGNAISFGSTPLDGSTIEVSTFVVGAAGSSGSSGNTTPAMTWSIVDANTTATINKGYFVDTTNGEVTLTLPSTATLGDTIRVNDVAGTFGLHQCVVNGNGNKIQNQTSDLLLDYNQASIGLVFSNATYGWKLMEL